MKTMLKHYKTTTIGLFSLFFGCYIGFVANDWLTASPFITSGFGFILASDGDSNEN